MRTTTLENDVIKAIVNSEYSDFPGCPIWVWSVADNTKIVNTKQVSGVISSLVKKELVKTDGECLWLTKIGIEEYNCLKEE